MTTNPPLTSREFPLSADFAAKVLARADVAIAARRRFRQIVLIAATASLAIASGSGMLYSVFRQSTSNPAAHAAEVVRADNRSAPALTENEEAQAVRSLFPDASPLAHFVQSYSASISGLGIDEPTAAADEAQDEWL